MEGVKIGAKKFRGGKRSLITLTQKHINWRAEGSGKPSWEGKGKL